MVADAIGHGLGIQRVRSDVLGANVEEGAGSGDGATLSREKSCHQRMGPCPYPGLGRGLVVFAARGKEAHVHGHSAHVGLCKQCRGLG
jgi:hypothetical protein